MNLPNKLTCARLVMGALLFAGLEVVRADAAASLGLSSPALGYALLGLFVAAVLTDALDGYIARKYSLETDFGRVADPFADKVVICGCFIYLTALGPPGQAPLVPIWVAVVILGREFLVNGLRGLMEGRGIKFGAKWPGKAKMILQSVAVAVALFCLATPAWSLGGPIARGLVWASLAATVLSAVVYLRAASTLLADDPLAA